jgi:DNA-binding NarL/FixJ family response regulator
VVREPVAGLALENERLAAELRARLVELQASRARLVEATDSERRRIERDLHDGTQQRLVSIAMSLGLVESKLPSNAAQSKPIVTETREALQAAKAIRKRWPRVGVLVLSQHVHASYAVELLSAGAEGVGYLLKERVSDLAELASSVRRVGAGGSVLDPAVVSQLVGKRQQEADPLTPLGQLSARERDVLALMAEGRSNKAIAERLFVSEYTVQKHVGNIFDTLRLPPSPDDHRRVLAVVAYLNAQ